MLGDLDSGLGVAVAVNATDERDLTEEVAEAILNLYRDGAQPSVVDPLAVENAADFAGVYTGTCGRLTVTAEGDRLVLDGQPLEPRGNDRFFADRPELAVFLLCFRREDDRVVEAGHGGDLYRREGVPAAPAPPPAKWSAYRGHTAPTTRGTQLPIALLNGKITVIFPWGLELALQPLWRREFSTS